VPASTLLSRRRLLGVAAAVTTVGLITPAPAISYAPRSIALYNTHTGEWLRTVYWADGHYIREAVRDINWILLVVSGYRSPATNMRLYLSGEGVAKHSYHTKAMAVDLRSERRSLEQVREAATSLQCGGVGYYPRSGFVHVDCGPIRHW
jgi:uncharacterized protein YcbK (DUF882 family)